MLEPIKPAPPVTIIIIFFPDKRGKFAQTIVLICVLKSQVKRVKKIVTNRFDSRFVLGHESISEQESKS